MLGTWWSHHTHQLSQSCECSVLICLSGMIFLALATPSPYGKRFWFVKLKTKMNLSLWTVIFFWYPYQIGGIIPLFILIRLSWDEFIFPKIQWRASLSTAACFLSICNIYFTPRLFCNKTNRRRGIFSPPPVSRHVWFSCFPWHLFFFLSVDWFALGPLRDANRVSLWQNKRLRLWRQNAGFKTQFHF